MDYRRRRKELNKNMSDVAKAVGVSIQTISRWETETAIPSMKHLKLFARVLQVDIDELRMDIIRKTEEKSESSSGDELINRTLSQLESDSHQMEEKVIIHSFSTRGFLTDRISTVARQVCKCAASGIEVVYFCFPSSLRPENKHRRNPGETKEAIRGQIEDSIRFWKSIGERVDESEIFNHLWAVTPSNEANAGEIERIYGNFVKPLTIIHAQRSSYPSSSVDNPWFRVVPKYFRLADIWMHLNETCDGDSDVPRWMRISVTDDHHLEYYDVVCGIRDNQDYSLSLLMKE